MSAKPDGGPAFPCEGETYCGTGVDAAAGRPYQWTDKFPGLSMRDWFAGQALAGILSNESARDTKRPQAAK